MTDAKGESRNPQFRQRFHGLRVRRPDPNGESGITCCVLVFGGMVSAASAPLDGARASTAPVSHFNVLMYMIFSKRFTVTSCDARPNTIPGCRRGSPHAFGRLLPRDAC